MPLQHINQKQAESMWYDCFDLIEKAVDKLTYETIIKNIKPVIRDSNTLELSLEKSWQRDHLDRYMGSIEDIFKKKTGLEINMLMTVNNRGGRVNRTYSDEPVISADPSNMHTPRNTPCVKVMDNPEVVKFLNPNYTFDNFIVGSGNRFAAAAAQAVAEAPALAYNPLFIYGGVGLGKTHLINAIGHRVIDSNPGARVVYVSTEKFMNDMIESITEKKMKQFRGKYRNVDVLLIDDIQFIKNKESTQEEFFHTFNELHGAKSQIVITSDRPPKDIPTLEDRLRSRFEWGLIADISQPDLETRIAILNKKTLMDGILVPPGVISYIAEMIPSNIRELEGALNRVVCFSSLMKKPISMDLAQSALQDIIPDTKPKHLTIKYIQERVCNYYQIKIGDMLGTCREQKLVVPRQIAMFFAKELVGASYPDIGKAFGGRDHTTIMHACRKIRKNRKSPLIKTDIENINNLLINPCE